MARVPGVGQGTPLDQRLIKCLLSNPNCCRAIAADAVAQARLALLWDAIRAEEKCVMGPRPPPMAPSLLAPLAGNAGPLYFLLLPENLRYTYTRPRGAHRAKRDICAAGFSILRRQRPRSPCGPLRAHPAGLRTSMSPRRKRGHSRRAFFSGAIAFSSGEEAWLLSQVAG